MDVDPNGLEVLDRIECLQLLGGRAFGRIAISCGALPMIVPVTFRLVGELVVVATGPGAKLRSAIDREVVAFEVDDFDVVSHAGWSVLVTGIARPVRDEAEQLVLGRAGVPRWLYGDDARLVAIDTEFISGRRLVGGRPESGRRPDLASATPNG
jgi:hypothetical protein